MSLTDSGTAPMRPKGASSPGSNPERQKHARVQNRPLRLSNSDEWKSMGKRLRATPCAVSQLMMNSHKQPNQKESTTTAKSYSYPQLTFKKSALAPGQDSIGTGGQDSIGANSYKPIQTHFSHFCALTKTDASLLPF